MTVERWSSLVGYPEYAEIYEVSDQGRIRSRTRRITYSNGREHLLPGQPIKPYVGTHGYLQVGLHRNDRQFTVQLHRLVARAFVPGYSEDLQVCHNNGDKTDNRAKNLRWGTASDNALDRRAHGREYRGNWTHCPHGHVLAQPNLVAGAWKRGIRNCLACARARGYLKGHPDLRDDFQRIADRYYQDIMNQEDD